jgi:HEAT repeat protein
MPPDTGGSSELLDALASPDPATRAAAVAAATLDPDTEEAVVGALRDPEPKVRLAAIGKLEDWGGSAALGALAEAATRDPAPEVRARAVGALGEVVRRRLRSD